jgi:S-DNA-T family DNA segregation ATPase FtsK/SpoIIIE
VRAFVQRRGGVRVHRAVSDIVSAAVVRRLQEATGLALVCLIGAVALALATWSVQDPSVDHATIGPVHNALGTTGAMVSDLLMQIFGLGALGLLLPPGIWGWRLITHRGLDRDRLRVVAWLLGTALSAAFASSFGRIGAWPLPTGIGGIVGDAVIALPHRIMPLLVGRPGAVLLLLSGVLAIGTVTVAAGFGLHGDAVSRDARFADDDDEDAFEDQDDEEEFDDGEEGAGGRFHVADAIGWVAHSWLSWRGRLARWFPAREGGRAARPGIRDVIARLGEDDEDDFAPIAPRRREPRMESRTVAMPDDEDELPAGFDDEDEDVDALEAFAPKAAAASKRGSAPGPNRVAPARGDLKPGKRLSREAQPSLLPTETYELPALGLLTAPPRKQGASISPEALEQNARLLEGVLEDFGVRGQIINVRPGPVVTLYELEPAPGIKSSRVIGLADDIARSMSAISARVAVVPGRNAIGIELPNNKRETVYLRELLASEDFEKARMKIPLCLGKTIGGEPVIAELARMPHLLIAGTTGSGKSVAINTMILSLLYRLKPAECRLIMIDPKMLELSVYDGIPHLLTPVVTDPKKAVVALKWAVREMEERYRNMSKMGVRNIDGFNQRLAQARAKGESLFRTVQTGFDRETGEAVYEREEMDLEPLPYLVIVVDEMADLMMVAGKDIEGAIQRLAQMARAAGIHLIMATQRPSVDVITGTIKANFPTRISFQVTSKIDSRTILGEQGAEQLLGQGDMLYMAGGGRISRVHGPFVSDEEVEEVVAYLKTQGVPDYLDAVTADTDEEGGEGADGAVFDATAMGGEGGGDLYGQAVQVVLRDKKCSTSYIQRRLQIGYNRAASLVERMEKEGIVGPANHAGKREILFEDPAAAESY